MKRLKSLLYSFVYTLQSYWPSNLPVGLTEFHKWSDRIIKITGPMADENSMKFALCSQIIHLPHTTSAKAPQFFVRSLRKAAANQVASQVFQDIKKQQEEAQKAANLKLVEDTTNSGVSTNDQKG